MSITDLVETLDRTIAEAEDELARLIVARAHLARTGSAPKPRDTHTRRTRQPGRTPRARRPPGGTKDAVLDQLKTNKRKALTAGQIAAQTGLGRASVSTTLSNLAAAGVVEKAAHGYRAKATA